MKETDIAIAGAGPAACIFALTINEKVSITILEQHSRQELGHDWLDSFDRKIVENYEFLQYIEKVADTKPPHFFSPDESAGIAGSFSNRIEIDRKILARNLIAAIEKKPNIEFIDQATVKAPIVENDGVKGVTFYKDGQEHILKSKLLIDATGYPAVIRKQLSKNFTHDIEKIDTLITFRKYIRRPDDLKRREYKIFFGKHRGLSWINTEMEDFIDLFAGVPNFPNRRDPKQIVQELEEILERECNQAINLEPIRANYYGMIPTRRCLDSFCTNGVLLIGDSACQVEPMTGSGIASGMLAGFIAAKLVNELFSSEKELNEENLWPYNHEWIVKVGAQYASLDIIRLFLLGRTESDYNFLFKKQIITEKDFNKSLIGEQIKIGFVELLQKLWRGWSRIGLLLALNGAIHDTNRIKTLYLSYPQQYDEARFKHWQEKKDAIFRKYYQKIKK